MTTYVKIESLNLDGCTSDTIRYIRSLEKEYHYKIDTIPIDFNNDTIRSFNLRKVDPYNILDIIEFMRELEIPNNEIAKLIIKNAKYDPGNYPDEHKTGILLPKIMTTNDLTNKEYNDICSLYNMDSWNKK